MASFGIFLPLTIMCLFTLIQLAKGTEMFYICQTSFQCWILPNPPQSHTILSPYCSETFQKSRGIESYLKITDVLTDFSKKFSTNYTINISTNYTTD